MGTCIHGQNQRQCDRCEDAAEKATLRADLAAMRKERDELRANRDRYSDLLDISLGVVREMRQRIAVAEAQSVYHPDDAAVDRFADAMKAKMAASRAKGRAGWENTDICPPGSLQRMLTDHLAKGDPVDVGNFAMMIFNRGESTNAPSAAVPAVHAPIPDGFMLVRKEWSPIIDEVNRRADKMDGRNDDFTVTVTAEEYRAADDADRNATPEPVIMTRPSAAVAVPDDVVQRLNWAYDHIKHEAYNDALSSILEAKELISARPAAPADDVVRDAERYRWLRSQSWNSAHICCVVSPRDAVKPGHDCPSGVRLDAAIDATLAASKQQENGQ